MMRGNCNLELSLLSPSFDHHSVDQNYHQQPMKEEAINGSPKEEQLDQKKLTIFYNGGVASCDVTDLQARSIILLASQEIEAEKLPKTEPSSPILMLKSQMYKENTGLSMKIRSLQQFLQKRRRRIQASSPYSH